MALNNFELGTTTGTTALHVFCAVNLFNQPDIYHFGTYNWVLLRHEQGAEQDVAEYWYVFPSSAFKWVEQDQADFIWQVLEGARGTPGAK
jgi:hypothetical protein